MSRFVWLVSGLSIALSVAISFGGDAPTPTEPRGSSSAISKTQPTGECPTNVACQKLEDAER